MNLLLFDRQERQQETVILSGRRADHILHVLRLSSGDTMRVGEINGFLGSAKIERVTRSTVTLRVELTDAPPPTPAVSLILALPRPIMVQRILKQATVLGISSIHLIRSRRVEKSYFHSPVLHGEKIRKILIEGLEQAMDTRMPKVSIHHRFKPFVEDVVPTLDGIGLLAHPGGEVTLNNVVTHGNEKKIVLAVGPEGGWSDFECQCFLDQGFTVFTMGPRILHVDTAVVSLLAQLVLLRQA